MLRGEVWVGNLNPNRGAEIGKVRPVLVIQEDALGPDITETVVVLPLTSQVREGVRHLRLTLPARDRLRRECQVLIDQPRTLDRGRIGDGPLTRLTGEEMAAVERTLKAVLGLTNETGSSPGGSETPKWAGAATEETGKPSPSRLRRPGGRPWRPGARSPDGCA